MAEPTPLVIVEGFLGGAGPLLWGNFGRHAEFDTIVDDEKPGRKVIFASVGPVSSLHDRACELYYALKGGTVDYGEDHARMNGHARYGRTYAAGLYSEWSRARPLHFLGHSMGGPTILKLQWLLVKKFFGDDDHPDMLLSVTTVSAPFRGTQAVYILGESIDSAPAVRRFSIGYLISKGVHVASYLSPLLPKFLDTHPDSRSLSYKHTGFASFLRNLATHEWATSRDAAPFDLTFEACDEREANGEGHLNPATYYRSYATIMTEVTDEDLRARPRAGWAFVSPLYVLSCVMGMFDFSALRPRPSLLPTRATSTDTVAEDINVVRANDGVVPLLSQWHPHDCSETNCRHRTFPKGALEPTSFDDNPQAGMWDVLELPETSHMSIAPFWFGTSRQRAFWRITGHWLRDIDNQAGPCV